MTDISLSNTCNKENTVFEFFKKRGPHYWIYLACFIVFSVNILPWNIPMILACVIFLFAPLDVSLYLYVFSLPWMYVSYVYGGITLSLVQSIVLILKILYHNRKLHLSVLDIVISIYLFTSGCASFIYYHSFTGISFLLYFLIATYMFNYANKKENEDSFWRYALFCVFCSSTVALFYGLVNSTGLVRWIRGYGYSTQLYGTMGTSRYGLYLCLSLLYPLFFVRNKTVKILLCVFISVCVLSTISITSIILLFLLYVYYFFFCQKFTVKTILVFACIILGVGSILIFWNDIAQISFIRPIVYRVNYIREQLSLGDANAATTGRTQLSSVFLERFEASPVLVKIFGASSIIQEGEMYSHNSFVDMLYYSGLLGSALLIILQVYRLKVYSATNNLKIVLPIKLLIILTGTTVSVFSAQFWQIWFFI